jgi:hypothetical protein
MKLSVLVRSMVIQVLEAGNSMKARRKKAKMLMNGGKRRGMSSVSGIQHRDRLLSSM